MTQLSNVPTQPTDATESLTLIEKLEQERKTHHDLMLQSPTLQDSAYYNGVTVGFMGAIGVVNQHSEWVPVSERLPPDNMMVLVYCHIRKTTGYAFVSHQQAWSFYHFTKNSENQALAMVNDISKWMPIPQPPSEVQDAT